MTDEVTRLTGTDPQAGLDRFELQQRQERFGPNALEAGLGGGTGDAPRR